MAGFDVFVFILCLVVFILLVGLVSYLIANNFKLEKQSILAGIKDEEIKKDFEKKAKESKTARRFSLALNIFLMAFFGSLLISSIAINISSNFTNQFTTIRVVESNSMSRKDETNEYLFDNNLNNQFKLFDIIVTHKLPKEEDLKLFDIVVYSQDGLDIIHRIIAIEEPNEKHPDCRHFTLRGDANVYSDKVPVPYSQMKAIYRNEKISFVGSFILFLQSPAGFLCVGLVVAVPFVSSFLENKINNSINRRLIDIDYIRLEDLSLKEQEKLMLEEKKGKKKDEKDN